MRRPVRRTRSGQFEIRLSAEERQLLRGLGPRMREVLAEDGGPVAERLFPVAYPGDEDRQAEYRLLAGDELRESHLGALDTLERTIDADRLDEEQAHAWVRALNQVRLVLGVRLGVTEEGTERAGGAGAGGGPDTFAVYDYLTWLQGEVIDALS